jgi:hypothetical protein
MSKLAKKGFGKQGWVKNMQILLSALAATMCGGWFVWWFFLVP